MCDELHLKYWLLVNTKFYYTYVLCVRLISRILNIGYDIPVFKTVWTYIRQNLHGMSTISLKYMNKCVEHYKAFFQVSSSFEPIHKSNTRAHRKIRYLSVLSIIIILPVKSQYKFIIAYADMSGKQLRVASNVNQSLVETHVFWINCKHLADVYSGQAVRVLISTLPATSFSNTSETCRLF